MGFSRPPAARLAGLACARLLCSAALLGGMLSAGPSLADTIGVSTDAELRAAIKRANSEPGPHFIEFYADIVLTGPLPPVLNTMTFKGRDFRLDGNNQHQLLSIGSAGAADGPRILVNVNDLTLVNGLAAGGDGADGGGGGMGAGGAIYVNARADVVLQNVGIADSHAVGGSGAVGLGGGGGGMGGDGGAGPGGGGGGLQGAGGAGGGAGGGGGALGDGGAAGLDAGGGGGGLGAGGSAGTDGSTGDWSPLWTGGGAAGDAAGGGVGGASGGGGGGGGGAAVGSITGGGGGGFSGSDASTDSGANAGTLGGGGGAAATGDGGHGGYAGGGGGALAGVGGDGGAAGGGGGSGAAAGGSGGYGGGGGSGGTIGGTGGFGGGGGSGAVTGGVTEGGGGAGGVAGGGGGAGLGGAIFVVEGGGLSIGGRTQMDGNNVASGAGANDGTAGMAAGGGLFLEGSGNLMVRGPTAGATQILADDISDAFGAGIAGALPYERWNLIVAGGSRDGHIELFGNNSYSGDTYILGSTLIVRDEGNLGGTNGIVVFDDGGLGMTDGFRLTRDTVVNSGGASFNVVEAGTATVAGNLRGEGEIIKTGRGDLEFIANTNFAGSWRVSQGALVLDNNDRLGTSSLTLDGGGLRFSSDINDFRGFAINASAILDNDGHNVTVVGNITGWGWAWGLGWGTYQTTTFRGGGDFVLQGSANGIGNTLIEEGRVIGDVANGNVQVNAGAAWLLGGGNRQVALLQGSGLVDLGANNLDVKMVQPVEEGVAAGGVFDGEIAGSGMLQVSIDTPLPIFTPLSAEASQLRMLTLTNVNTYAGGTRISSGAAIGVSTDASLGSGGVILSGGVLSHSAQASDVDIFIDGSGGGIATVGNDLTYTGTISGAGTFVKSGTGTLLLESDNTWNGDAWVVGTGSFIAMHSADALGSGDLILAAGGGLSLLGNTPDLLALYIAGGGGVVDTGNFNARTSGGIFSSAPEDRLIKQGDGTLVIAGDSSFGGTLEINGGTVQYGDGGNVGSLQGHVEVLSGASLVLNRADSFDLTGVISGQGRVVKRGAGTLTLGGVNSFAGGLFVESGYVAGTNDALGSGQVTLDNGGIDMRSHLMLPVTVGPGFGELLITAASDVFAVSSTVNGSGMLVKSGAGTLVIEGAVMPVAGVRVQEGLLQVGNGFVGNLFADANVNSGATLMFSREDTLTYAHAISGTGEVVKRGPGNLLLTGDSTYSGLTRVESGMLQVGTNGTSGSIVGDVQLAAGTSLQFARSNTVVYPGTVSSVASGDGVISQDGFGRLQLTGDSSAFTGTLTVGRGVVQLDGILGGNVDGFAGALEGVGRVAGSVRMYPGSYLRPGDGSHSLTIDGDLSLDSGARWGVDVFDDGRVDHVTVGGTAQLGGDLFITGDNNGAWPDASAYRILDANTVVGTFARVDENLAFFDARIDYGSDFVDLRLIRNGIAFTSGALTQNQQSVAAVLDAMPDTDPVTQYVLSLDIGEPAAAFDALSGDSLLMSVSSPARFGGAFAQTLQRRSSRLGLASRGPQDALALFDDRFALIGNGGSSGTVFDVLENIAVKNPQSDALLPMSVASRSRVDGVWLESREITQTESANEIVGNPAADMSGNLLTIGIDGYWSDSVILGAAISQAQGSTSFSSRTASADIGGVILGSYGRWDIGDSFHSKFSFSIGQFSNAMRRSVPVGMPVQSEASVGVLGASAEAGMTLRVSKWSLRPYGQLMIERAVSGQYLENGGVAALYVDEARIDRLQVGVGLDASRPWLIGVGQWAQLQGTIGLAQPLGDSEASQTAAFASSGIPFTVSGAPDEATVFALGLSGEWYFGSNLALSAGYQLRAGGEYDEQGVLLGLNARW